MSETIETVEIGVGLVFDDERKKILLVWSDNWGGFSLPMTKIRLERIYQESAEDAALRAVAEAVHLPTQLAKGKSAQRGHCLLKSQRTNELKGYNYHISEVEIQPAFRKWNREHRPVIWAPIKDVLSGEIQPATWSVNPILAKCGELEWF